MRKYWIAYCLLVIGFLFSCEDNDALPAYRQDLAELQTDETGKARYLILDDGSVLSVTNTVSGLVPDTVFRVQALYLMGQGDVILEGASLIVSSLPRKIDEMVMCTDPVEIRALWHSKRYLNVLVAMKTGGGKQVYGFTEKNIETMKNGCKKLHLALYHDQKDDPLFYTQEAYMSCPIYGYADQLEAGKDSVEFEIQTFDGVLRKSFLY